MKCSCCGSDQIGFFKEKNRFKTYRCKNCGVVFVYPLPRNELLHSLYTQRTAPDRAKLLREIIQVKRTFEDSSVPIPKRDWFEWVINEAKEITGKTSLRMLEIGSGVGMFVHHANRAGHFAIGTESNEVYAEIVSSVIDGNVAFVGEELQSYFKHEKFDLIFLEHSLEHMRDPVKTLYSMLGLLEPNGIIIMSVPNHNSLLSRFLGKRWAWFVPPIHLFYYTIDSIYWLFHQVGLHVLHYFTRDFHFRSIYQFYSLRKYVTRIVNLYYRIFKKKLQFDSKKYPPTTILEKINYLPYYLLYPLIKFSERQGWGSELVVVAQMAR